MRNRHEPGLDMHVSPDSFEPDPVEDGPPEVLVGEDDTLESPIGEAEFTLRIWEEVCGSDGERLDTYLADRVEGLSRTRAAALLGQGYGTVDGRQAKPGLRLRTGQRLFLRIPPDVPLEVVPQNLPLDIVYEDDALLVVNKGKGMVVHPAPGHPDGTLVNALMYQCGARLSTINGIIRPGIVHRIDRDTSGLLVVAKTDQAHRVLSEELQRHEVARTYLAMLDGRLKQERGTVNLPIGRHPGDRKRMSVRSREGRHAVTHFEVLEWYGTHTLVKCRLETGRTHQIRVHMASLGHPVTGDPVYGKPCRLMNTQGQALHAIELALTHPVSQSRLVFTTPMPDWMARLIHCVSRK
jgi:23S rRNA pseudouridine1911/1915/1917 synthase